MATSMSGGKGMEAHLAKLIKQLDKPQTLRVGFLEDAKYPDEAHTPVAQVAAWLNFGTKTAPPRPFFSDMVAAKSPAWADKLGRLMVLNDGDIEKSLGQMGEGIKAQLQAALVELDAPALSKITLMLRKMRIGNVAMPITGAMVGEAARRVAAGESTSPASDKVGVYSGHMLNSVGWDVQL